MIPAEAVEAAAKWLHDYNCRSAVHSGFPADEPCYDWREEGLEVLEAAAPYIMAEAWDEGMVAMYESTSHEWSPIPEQNPYMLNTEASPRPKPSGN